MPDQPTNAHFGSIAVDVRSDGIAIATFSRPPVNAVSLAVYEDLGRLVDFIESHSAIRTMILAAPPDARAWCGGADLNDFTGMTAERRLERYAFINEQLPRFHAITRPTIAAITGASIGVGMVLASLCDFRIAAVDAHFALPEVDFGLLSGCAGRFVALRMPEPKVREMLYTGRKFTARELEPTGFFNYVVERSGVLPAAIALAREIAAKDPAIMQARKRDSLALEGTAWFDAYLSAQAGSSKLVGKASRAGVNAALKIAPASE